MKEIFTTNERWRTVILVRSVAVCVSHHVKIGFSRIEKTKVAEAVEDAESDLTFMAAVHGTSEYVELLGSQSYEERWRCMIDKSHTVVRIEILRTTWWSRRDKLNFLEPHGGQLSEWIEFLRTTRWSERRIESWRAAWRSESNKSIVLEPLGGQWPILLLWLQWVKESEGVEWMRSSSTEFVIIVTWIQSFTK